MTARDRPRMSAVRRITTLALVLLAVGALMVVYAATARRTFGTRVAVAPGQVLLDATVDDGRPSTTKTISFAEPRRGGTRTVFVLNSPSGGR